MNHAFEITPIYFLIRALKKPLQRFVTASNFMITSDENLYFKISEIFILISFVLCNWEPFPCTVS